MAKFFNPAVRLMHQLKYPQKFTLISLLFALPLGLVLTLLVSEIDYQIDSTQKEINGTRYGRRACAPVPRPTSASSATSCGATSPARKR